MWRLGGIPLVAAVVVWALPAWAQDERTVVRHGPDGAVTVQECSSAGWPLTDLRPVKGWSDTVAMKVSQPRTDAVIWHNTLTDAIYNNTAISLPAGRLCAGTYLNPPKEFELIPLEGNGTPDWVYPGTEFYVAASRDAQVLAGLDYNSSTTTATVYKWHPGSSTPDWSYPIQPCSRATHRSLAVSPDGALIAVLVTMQASPNYARLYYFDPSSPIPLGTYDPLNGTFARSLAISAHGEYVAIYAGAQVCVFDTLAGLERYCVSAGATAEGVAISGDGRYLAYGWSTLYFREWDGATYALRWSRPGSGSYLGKCALSTDGSTLVAGWYRSDFLQNKIELYDTPSSTPAWTRLYQVASGSYQDIPADVAVTAEGGFCAVASWGDAVNTNPEVHVFKHASSTPVLTLDTPGSMFDVDIAALPGGRVYISACGKHVHANQSGRGGDLYSLRYESLLPGDLNCDGQVSFGDINPFVLILADPVAWQAQYPGCPPLNGDINGDNQVNFGDINPFVALLSGP